MSRNRASPAETLQQIQVQPRYESAERDYNRVGVRRGAYGTDTGYAIPCVEAATRFLKAISLAKRAIERLALERASPSAIPSYSCTSNAVQQHY